MFLGQWLGQDLGQSLGQDFAGHDSVIAEFADGAYTGASACSVDYGGSWTDFAGGAPPIVTIGGKKYIQVETASENKFTRVRELDHGDWTDFHVSASVNAAVAPDGTTTAEKIVEDSADNLHYIYQSPTPDGSSNYVFSDNSKAGERNWLKLQFHTAGYVDNYGKFFDLSDGSLGSDIGGTPITYGIEDAGGGWFRSYISGLSDAATATIHFIQLADADGGGSYQGDGSSGLYVWNPQVEIGYYPSSPINSGATATTRAKDEFVWLEADVPSALRGAISFNWIPYWGSDYLGDVTLIEFDESGASDNIRVWYDATDQKIYVDDETGSATKVTSDALTITRFDVITITLDPTAGSITVSGATGGNGTNVDTAWSTSAGDVYLGGNEAGSEQIEGLISEPY